MATVDFNHKEIQDLARKVGTLEPFFSEKEHALLLSIFAAAVDQIEVPDPDHGVLPLAEIGTQAGEGDGADGVGGGIEAGGAGAAGGSHPTLSELQGQLLTAFYPGSTHRGGITAKITGSQPIG
jgi:hypothetical protein